VYERSGVLAFNLNFSPPDRGRLADGHPPTAAIEIASKRLAAQGVAFEAVGQAG